MDFREVNPSVENLLSTDVNDISFCERLQYIYTQYIDIVYLLISMEKLFKPCTYDFERPAVVSPTPGVGGDFVRPFVKALGLSHQH